MGRGDDQHAVEALQVSGRNLQPLVEPTVVIVNRIRAETLVRSEPEGTRIELIEGHELVRSEVPNAGDPLASLRDRIGLRLRILPQGLHLLLLRFEGEDGDASQRVGVGLVEDELRLTEGCRTVHARKEP